MLHHNPPLSGVRDLNHDRTDHKQIQKNAGAGQQKHDPIIITFLANRMALTSVISYQKNYRRFVAFYGIQLKFYFVVWLLSYK